MNVVTVGPKRFNADSVDIRDNVDTVPNIQPHADSNVIVTLIGDEDEIDDLSVRVEGNFVVIEKKKPEEPPPAYSNRVNIKIGGNVNAGIANFGGTQNFKGPVKVTGYGTSQSEIQKPPKLQIKVQIPVNGTSRLSGRWEQATIGDTFGPVEIPLAAGEAAIQDGVTTRIGRVGSLDLNLSEWTKTEIEHVQGSIKAVLTDKAKIIVNNGDVTDIEVSAANKSNAQLHVKAETAELKGSGKAIIHVNYVEHKPKTDSDDMSEITVGNWPSI